MRESQEDWRHFLETSNGQITHDMGAYHFSKGKENLPDCEGIKCDGHSALYLTFMRGQKDEESELTRGVGCLEQQSLRTVQSFDDSLGTIFDEQAQQKSRAERAWEPCERSTYNPASS